MKEDVAEEQLPDFLYEVTEDETDEGQLKIILPPTPEALAQAVHLEFTDEEVEEFIILLFGLEKGRFKLGVSSILYGSEKKEMSEQPDPKDKNRGTMKIKPTADEIVQMLNEKIRFIKHLQGIKIEQIGSFLWVTGDTKKNKDALKNAGFTYHRTKQCWYFAPVQKKYYSKEIPMPVIKAEYMHRTIIDKILSKEDEEQNL